MNIELMEDVAPDTKGLDKVSAPAADHSDDR